MEKDFDRLNKKEDAALAGGGSTVVPRMVLRTNLVPTSISHRNAALADGVSSIVPHTVLERAELVPSSIADRVLVSSEEMSPVDNASLKPDRGIEPLGHEMTSSTLHHASGYGRFYHALLLAPILLLLVVSWLLPVNIAHAATRLQMPPNYLILNSGFIQHQIRFGAGLGDPAFYMKNVRQ